MEGWIIQSKTKRQKKWRNGFHLFPTNKKAREHQKRLELMMELPNYDYEHRKFRIIKIDTPDNPKGKNAELGFDLSKLPKERKYCKGCSFLKAEKNNE